MLGSVWRVYGKRGWRVVAWGRGHESWRAASRLDFAMTVSSVFRVVFLCKTITCIGLYFKLRVHACVGANPPAAAGNFL